MNRQCLPKEILSEIIAKGEISSFDVKKPSLHDIFIRIAGKEAEEIIHA